MCTWHYRSLKSTFCQLARERVFCRSRSWQSIFMMLAVISAYKVLIQSESETKTREKFESSSTKTLIVLNVQSINSFYVSPNLSDSDLHQETHIQFSSKNYKYCWSTERNLQRFRRANGTLIKMDTTDPEGLRVRWQKAHSPSSPSIRFH